MRHTAFLLALAPLVACTPIPPGSTPPPAGENGGKCNAQAAQILAGQAASSDTGARALSLTGASRLRWGPPNTAWTMDYREDRVNVRYNEAMTITEVTCG